MSRFKILEIGSYPPPFSGWSVRIKYIRDAFREAGDLCEVLNLGKNRKIKSPEYIDVQSGQHYIKNLLRMRLKGYVFHIHINAQAVKGPILGLMAHLISLVTCSRAALTFHGGLQQLYYPKQNGGLMYPVIWLNFFLANVIVCNDEAIKREIVKYGPLIKATKIHPIPAFSQQYLRYETVPLAEEIEAFSQNKKSLIVSYIVLRNGFYIETLLEFLESLSEDVGVILTGIGVVEDGEVSDLYQKLRDFETRGRVFLAKSLNHNEFLSLLARADIYLRTPTSDGVASSVLEALSVGTQVVASENGRRPEGVVRYVATDSKDMRDKINHVLEHIDALNKTLVLPEVDDTVKTEIMLLKKGR
ncbi:MAG: glycosyltransferase family 4 protein [Nitrospirae bacterium]|nr:glycosyltransferase family 4 protein [Candidatus Manganitrophaceae bacterium]